MSRPKAEGWWTSLSCPAARLPLPADTKAPHMLLVNAYRLRDLIRERNIALVHARSRAPAWSACGPRAWRACRS